MSQNLFRAGGSVATAAKNRGLLKDLPGRWQGKGFNMIARPTHGDPAHPVFFLQLNATSETLEFTSIGGDIPNRGSVEPTRLLHGVHYLQTVTDCADGSGIHKEPGIWIRVPGPVDGDIEVDPTTDPDPHPEDDTYVRLATIPHGDSLVAQSTAAFRVPQGPQIDAVTTFPFPLTDPIPGLNDVTHAVDTNPRYTAPFTTSALPAECLPAGLDAAATIKDPTEVLRAQIAGQTITDTVVLVISTSFPDPRTPPLSSPQQLQGIVNIPFVISNATATQMDAIFWIEKVQSTNASDGHFLQLQYVQRVILDFAGLHWPHVSVATLVKAE